MIINGYKGRMGQALLSCAKQMPELTVVAQTDQGDSLDAVVGQADVVIDFSFHSVTAEAVRVCAQAGKALVIGTTGHSDTEKALIRSHQAQIPMVWASNYSTGVNTLFWLTRKAAQILGPSFDLEVVEMHHRLKKDAPSGTATTLAEILADAEIGMHAVRGGDVVGDHTVIYADVGERVELTHKASSRDTFANGALRAAAWVVRQPAGIYDMQDVLGLK